MNRYLVTWEIDIDADNPRDAAEQAFTIMQDPDTFATVFYVRDESGNLVRIDLLEEI